MIGQQQQVLRNDVENSAPDEACPDWIGLLSLSGDEEFALPSADTELCDEELQKSIRAKFRELRQGVADAAGCILTFRTSHETRFTEVTSLVWDDGDDSVANNPQMGIAFGIPGRGRLAIAARCENDRQRFFVLQLDGCQSLRVVVSANDDVRTCLCDKPREWFPIGDEVTPGSINLELSLPEAEDQVWALTEPLDLSSATMALDLMGIKPARVPLLPLHCVGSNAAFARPSTVGEDEPSPSLPSDVDVNPDSAKSEHVMDYRTEWDHATIPEEIVPPVFSKISELSVSRSAVVSRPPLPTVSWLTGIFQWAKGLKNDPKRARPWRTVKRRLKWSEWLRFVVQSTSSRLRCLLGSRNRNES